MAERTLGWRLDSGDRDALLARFTPRYSRTIADHITHGRADEAPALPDAGRASVIGRADDGTGVEALVVALDASQASSPERWDGSRYHITWSLEPGREAKESNDVIAIRGWEAVDGQPSVGLVPAEWP